MIHWLLTLLIGSWVVTIALTVIYAVVKSIQHHRAMRRTLREIQRLPERERS